MYINLVSLLRAKTLEMQAGSFPVKHNNEIQLKFSVQVKWNHIMGTRTKITHIVILATQITRLEIFKVININVKCILDAFFILQSKRDFS
jgi:hypothetical protein